MQTSQAPMVSICIPAYKQTDYLRILLDSISGQLYTDYEIIISDDSPNDEIKQLVNSYTFPRSPHYFHNPNQLGSPENWNAAIEKSHGKYVKIMHHDDAFATPGSLGMLVKEIESGDYDFVFAETKVVNVKNPLQNRIHKIRNLRKYIAKPTRLFFGNALGAPSTLLLKKDLASQLKYDKAFIWLVDVEYYIRLFKSSSRGNVVHQPLILTHDSASHQITTALSTNFILRFTEQALLYNLLAPHLSRITIFFMNIYLLRLLFKDHSTEDELASIFVKKHPLMTAYFKYRKTRIIHYSLYLFVRFFDLIRKLTY